MATFLKILVKVERIDHLQFNTYHTVQKIVKIGPADPEILRLQATKFGTTQNWLPWQHPLRYWKKLRYTIYTQNAFIWCKKCKIAHGVCFACDTKFLAMATSLQNRKKWTGSRKFTQIPFILWKDRENRSSRYWDSFADSKKINKEKMHNQWWVCLSVCLWRKCIDAL